MYKSDINKVLKLLTTLPPLIIILLSIIITSYVVIENQNNFDGESLKFKKKFLNKSRLEIYNEVNRIESYINNENSYTESNLKSNLKHRVNDAYSIITGILDNNTDLDKEKLIKLITDSLRNIRFNNGRGYYYIYSMKGECILLPIKSELEGKSFLDVRDVKGKFITKSIIKSIREGKDEFMSWWWYKPSDMNKMYKKISYNKYIKELDMYIGTGDYVNDFESETKNKVLNYISNLRYEEGKYFFILDYDGNVIFHPNKKIEDMNLNSFNNNDKYNLKEIVEMGKRGEGYISYGSTYFGLYNQDMIKTSFIKGYDKWQWVIGRGFYKNEVYDDIVNNQNIINKQNEKFIVQVISFSIILTLFLVLIIYYNVKLLKNLFNEKNQKIKRELKLNAQKDKMLFHQSKMASLGEMLQNIAHQWRQPLSVISTSASGLKIKRDYGILDDAFIDESVYTIMKSTNYLSKTIEDFRDFFKHDKAQENFNIKNPIKDALEILNVKFIHHEIKIVFNEINYDYFGYRNELIQVIMNILVNSMDALSNVDKKLILINIKVIDNEITISMRDSAGGISEKVIDRIFEPYFTTKHQSQGTGIGLYMSEEIISKRLNGQISVENCNYEFENEKYIGANFIIKLPIKKGQLKN